MIIDLFSSYFLCDNPKRQSEIDGCLDINLHNPHINRIFLFLDKNIQINQVIKRFGIKKLKFILLGRRNTYKDWLIWSRTLSTGHISVLANSDICLDGTISNIEPYLGQNKSIVCLTRHESSGKLHIYPDWSQDLWAIRAEDAKDISFLSQLEIELGWPGCDNKMACAFAMNGWDLFNPCGKIRCLHVHEGSERQYEKSSPSYAGFLATVPESKTFKEASKVSIFVSPVNCKNIKEARLTNFLEKRLLNP